VFSGGGEMRRKIVQKIVREREREEGGSKREGERGGRERVGAMYVPCRGLTRLNSFDFFSLSKDFFFAQLKRP
jgi:hypothetical protein